MAKSNWIAGEMDNNKHGYCLQKVCDCSDEILTLNATSKMRRQEPVVGDHLMIDHVQTDAFSLF